MFSQRDCRVCNIVQRCRRDCGGAADHPLLPMATIDAEDPHGMSVRCRLGMQGVMSGTASFRAVNDCGAGRGEELRLRRTAVSADVHANRAIFHALTSSRSS